MKNPLLLSLLLFALTTPIAHAGDGKSGGGGTIEELRQAGALSQAQMLSLLKNNGRKLKEKALQPFLETLEPDQIASVEIRQKVIAMGGNKWSEFLEMVPWFVFRIEGCQCPDTRQNACRIESAYETYTCFNLNKLIADNTSFSELVGIAVHEISRITIPPDSPDQDDNHKLANYVEFSIQSQGIMHAPNFYIKRCASKIADTSDEITACRQIINRFAFQCAKDEQIIDPRGIDLGELNACSSINTQAEYDCLLKRDKSFAEIVACDFEQPFEQPKDGIIAIQPR